MRKFRGLAVVAVLAGSLAGCNGQNPFAVEAVDDQQQAMIDPAAANVPEVGNDLGRAKEFFRNRNFGLAEKHFRAVVETTPGNVEGWLGLAATHDQLGRYDLADRAYAQVARKGGTSFELLNNRGYSYMMRGDFNRARRDFAAALRLDPQSEFVRNNLRELDEKASGRG